MLVSSTTRNSGEMSNEAKPGKFRCGSVASIFESESMNLKLKRSERAGTGVTIAVIEMWPPTIGQAYRRPGWAPLLRTATNTADEDGLNLMSDARTNGPGGGVVGSVSSV